MAHVVTTNTGGNDFLTRVYNCKNNDDLTKLYDDWAESFDGDVTGEAQNYVAPALAAQAVVQAGGNIDGVALDAGCGTGLSGVALSKVGARTIDGLDISPGMLKVARRTGVYRDLQTADLSKPVQKGDNEYDIIFCIGTWTHGHVGPKPSFQEFIRVVKQGGIIAGTVLDDIWTSHGFEAEVERLEKEGLVEVVSTNSMDYRKGAGVTAKIVVLRKK
ncbi:Putative methyltransferase type 11, S-adenosyl-L-methionine-dependent methyltransferase [Septoria linicola]|uniref:Methyltransferase type 11, S-adenosyl-L-methionine-dependent methyltransferase n=1 Tax=Septoria linicola TaxID=215465 RepID=A0A9Q9B039_9PEZI|nr:Putative methyltransferase type 11, S-adenosyl-L-methionine-dependent methyltransferase [Septoria linicola]